MVYNYSLAKIVPLYLKLCPPLPKPNLYSLDFGPGFALARIVELVPTDDNRLFARLRPDIRLCSREVAAADQAEVIAFWAAARDGTW